MNGSKEQFGGAGKKGADDDVDDENEVLKPEKVGKGSTKLQDMVAGN